MALKSESADVSPWQGGIVLWGYGELAISILDFLQERAPLAAVVVPINRAGADRDLFAHHARSLNLPVLIQPWKRDLAGLVEQLGDLKPDLFLVCSYPMILAPELLALPRRGSLNFHGGILPRHRGANVLNWVLIEGERETGVTLHFLDPGVDTGDVVDILTVPISDQDTALSLRARLDQAVMELLERWWPAIEQGRLPRHPQQEADARHYPRRKPEDGLLEWSWPAGRIHNLVRALVSPWPGAFVPFRGHNLVVRRARVLPGKDDEGAAGTPHHPPGTILSLDRSIEVATGEGSLAVEQVEWQGQEMDGSGFAELQGLSIGQLLGDG